MLSGQDLLDYVAKHVKVRFEILSNIERPCKSKITFLNNGDETICDDGWAIYTYHLCDVESDNPQVAVEHVVGGLFKYTPTSDFKKLLPGGTLEVFLKSNEPTASRSYVFPNWYATKLGLQPRLLESTTDETLSFVGDFDDFEKWKKSASDESNPLSPEDRYRKCVVKDLGKAQMPIIPTPLEENLCFDTKVILSGQRWVILNNNDMFDNEAKILSEYLGTDIIKNETENDAQFIKFCCTHISFPQCNDDGYKISIKAETPSIILSAHTSAGMFYAVQSMISLIENQPNDSIKCVPCGSVVDAPRFPYRGFHIDVARNFVPADEIMKLICVMSAYKMNKLHFHLTDDEGWRLQIEDLPELTDIGAKRDHDLARVGFAVEPTLGSGPHFASVATNGYYTVEDYQNILRCAAANHVQVIPEIDMPGHSYSAVVAMNARYRHFKSKGDLSAAEEYLIVDIDDQSLYSSDQKYTNNTMNPLLKGTKNFVAKIIQSLIGLHEPIQPLKIFHIGGDEVPIGAWDGSPICEDYFRETKVEYRDLHFDPEVHQWTDDEMLSRKKTAALQEYFIQYVREMCREKKLQLAVWNDGIWNPTLKQNCDVPDLVHAWRISRKDERHNPNILANSGYQVVISSATHTYFDHPYESDPEEAGLTWCVRMMDTKTVFGMKPLDMYGCQGKEFSGVEHKKLENRSAVIGIQSHIWGELIRNSSKLEYMLFPRLLAIAERAWHEGCWEVSNSSSEMKEDWCNFANTLGYKELRRLREMGINFRIPPPGVRLQGDTLDVGCCFPNLKFKYRAIAEDCWKDASPSMSVLEFTKSQKYQFVTCDGLRTSRAVSVPF